MTNGCTAPSGTEAGWSTDTAPAPAGETTRSARTDDGGNSARKVG